VDRSNDTEDGFCKEVKHGFIQFPKYNMKILLGEGSEKSREKR
jgi:hypothetical protein